jgi:hypothetical protein
MKRLAYLVAALLLPACASLRSEPPLKVAVGEVKPIGGGPNVGVGVTLSNAGRRPTKRVVGSCAYFDAAGAAVGSGLVYFNNLAAGASETIGQMVVVPGVVRGDCAVRRGEARP